MYKTFLELIYIHYSLYYNPYSLYKQTKNKVMVSWTAEVLKKNQCLVLIAHCVQPVSVFSKSLSVYKLMLSSDIETTRIDSFSTTST